MADASDVVGIPVSRISLLRCRLFSLSHMTVQAAAPDLLAVQPVHPPALP